MTNRRFFGLSGVLALLMVALSSGFTSAGYVPSILKASLQYGTTSLASTTSNTSTITSVDTTASYIVNDGCKASENVVFGNAYSFCRVELTNATTVTVTRNAQAGGTLTAAWHVVPMTKFFVKSIQSGTISIATSSSSGTATLGTAVTTNRAILSHLGCTGNFDGSALPADQGINMRVTSTTQVTAERVSASATYAATCGYTVVDLR